MTKESDLVRALLPKLLKRKGISYAEASKAADKNHAYIQQFITKGSPRFLPEDVRHKLAALLEVDEDVLKSGSGATTEVLPISPTTDFKIAGQNYLPVPVYDIRASAGAGALVEDGDPTSHQIFRENFIRRISRAPIEMLSVIQVSGDSMWETLHEGDSVLVDRTVNKVAKDGIYILAVEDELLVKRCQRDLSDMSVVVKSDNPKYDTFRVTEADRLQVLGRVIWIGRALG